VRSDRTATLGVIVLACALSAPRVAAASDGPPKSKADKAEAGDADERAAKWLSRGNKAFKEGRFADAEQAYREAFALKKGYDIAGNLGAAELAQGKRREAAQHLAFTLRMFPLTGEPALREQMQKAYDQCRAEVGALHVEASVKGAQILVDGAVQGEAPLPDDVFLEPGEHTVEARLDGFTGAPQRVTVQKGVAARVELPLTPVVVQAPEAPPVVREEPPKRRSIIPGIALGAVAAVGIGGGVAFVGMSSGKRSAAEATRGQILTGRGSCVPGAGNLDARCSDLQNNLKASDTFHDVAVGAFIAGGIAAAGTLAYFLWPARPARSAGYHLQVTPVFGASAGAVILSGSF
jgi:hypothetical protein